MIDSDSAALPAGQADVDEESADDIDTEVNLAVEHDDGRPRRRRPVRVRRRHLRDSGRRKIADDPVVAFGRRHRYDADKAAAVTAGNTPPASGFYADGADAGPLLGDGVPGHLVGVVVRRHHRRGDRAYLGYLRKQTRIEERVRRRRMQRMARSQLGVENTYDRKYDVVPSRLRRPGAVVLEIDDEDPIFEHLDYGPYAREYSWASRGRQASSVSGPRPRLVA